MKVLITGSRNWEDAAAIEGWLKAVRATVLVHGDHSRGADAMAKTAAIRLGIEQRPYPADWRGMGRTAGPMRNQQMVDVEHVVGEPIDAAMGFPTSTSSSGTWDCITRCVKAGIKTDVWRWSKREQYNGVWFCDQSCSFWHSGFHGDCRFVGFAKVRRVPLTQVAKAREATADGSVSLVNDGESTTTTESR